MLTVFELAERVGHRPAGDVRKLPAGGYRLRFRRHGEMRTAPEVFGARAEADQALWEENVRLWAKTWSQLTDDCEVRLRHFEDALEYDASKEHAADYISRAHASANIPAPFRGPKT